MNVVLDANLIVALVLPLPYSEAAASRVAEWKRRRVPLVAPALWTYEVGSVLRRALVTGFLEKDQLAFAADQLRRLNITAVPDSPALQDKAFDWAARLGQSKIYDSCYLAVAESLQADFWTANRSLANAARAAGAAWVRAIQS